MTCVYMSCLKGREFSGFKSESTGSPPMFGLPKKFDELIKFVYNESTVK